MADWWNVRKFYIGTTNDLAARKTQTGCDKIISLYQADSPDRARVVEGDLVKWFKRHWKYSNQTVDTIAAATDEEGCTVYIALWYTKS